MGRNPRYNQILFGDVGALSPAHPSETPVSTSLPLGLVLSPGHPFISMPSAEE